MFRHIPTLAFRDPLVGPPSIGFRGGPVILDTCDIDFMRYVRYMLDIDPDVLDPALVTAAHRYLAAALTELVARPRL